MFTVTGNENLNQKKFTGPVTADTSDEDLNTLGQINGYSLGVPKQITTHLLKLQRHILQLERRLEKAPHLANVERRDH
jgi:hypothetical protein